MAVINELITELGINLKEGSVKKIDEIEGKISGLTESFEKIGKTMTGGLGIKDFFGGALGRAQDIMNSAKAIGFSTKSLQEWQYAAKASGVSAESVISDLDNLHTNFFMSEKGVLRLADSFKRMSIEGARWWGNQLGISDQTVLMLRQGSGAIKDLQAEAHKMNAIIPEEELEKARKMNLELEVRKEQFRKLADMAAYRLIPIANKLLETFNKWMGDDPARTEMVIQGITAALITLTSSSVINGILNLLSTLTPIANIFSKISKGAISAIGAIAKFALKGPAHLLLVSAAIGAVALAGKALYDDFQKYKKGEDSFVPWGKFENAAGKAKKALADFREEMERVWNESPEGLRVFIKGFGEGLVDAIHSAWSAVQELMGGLLVLMEWAATDRTWEGLKKKMKALHEGVWEWQEEKEKESGQDKKQKQLYGPRPGQHTPSITAMAGSSYNMQAAIDKMTDIMKEIPANSNNDLQAMMYNMGGKNLVTEVGLKSTSVRALAESMNEISTTPTPSMAPVVRDANFNGANINIITGANTEDIIEAMTSMGGSVNDSYSGTGFIY